MTVRMMIATGFVATLLVSCASDPRNANKMTFEAALAYNDQSAERLAEGRAEIANMNDDEVRQRLQNALSDVTAIIKQTGHGIYVEYTAPDGRLLMWYPGNGGTVVGTWGISDDFSPPRACFRYFGAYHGVTGEFEPNECVSPEQTVSGAYVVDRRSGDVFELRTKGIPYTKSAGNLPPWPEEWEDFE